LGTHAPPLQKLPLEQSPSTVQPPLHAVPEHTLVPQLAVWIAGQFAPLPVHLAWSVAVLVVGSQLAARHSRVDGWKASDGQPVLVPLHFSSTSHTSAAARHTVPFEANTSAGQDVDVPPHFSSTSHGPVAARHTVPELPAGC
jgi:hypothetical protein